jgi:hypothetical protein
MILVRLYRTSSNLHHRTQISKGGIVRKVVALLATVAALATAGVASGATPKVIDGDGGGTPSIGFFWIDSWTYIDGRLYYVHCQWASDGNVVWQLGCTYYG